MFKNPRWIRNPENHIEGLLLRKEFTLKSEVLSATLYIIGLGYGIYYINGKEVTEDVLTTQFTNFDKRILYNKYDVTKLLSKGVNCIAASVGNGFYNIFERNTWNFDTANWRDAPKLICELEIIYADSVKEYIVSDSSWKVTTEGPVRYNIPRGGEIYDARMEKKSWNEVGFDDSGWSGARIAKSPGGALEENVFLNPKIIREIKPVSVSQKNVYDFGESTTGWVKFSAKGEAGATLRIVYSERVGDDGNVDPASINQHNLYGKLKHEEIYIFKGNGIEEHRPLFNFHGFRYVQVFTEGDITDIDLIAEVVHTDIKRIGSFECSDGMINKIHEACVRSILTNYLSIPMDCPHREQNGWTGDAYFSAQTSIMNFDMKLFYQKWLRDIRDTQRSTGQISAVVPVSNCWGYFACGGPVWDGALNLIPLEYYEYTGDTSLLEENIEAIKKDVDFFETMTDNYLYGDSESIGDWVPPGREPVFPATATCTAYFYKTVKALEKACEILGQDSSYYKDLAEKIRSAYREKFVSADNIGSEGQLDYAVAIYCGLLEPDEEAAAAKKLNELVIEKDHHIDCGTTGTKAIFTALSKYGYDETLYKMVTNPTYPSYAYWMNKGSANLCEAWSMGSSLNHHMFSEVDHWFLRYLAGIGLSENGLVIEPHFIGLEYVKASHKDIEIEFDREKINIKSGREFTLKLNGKTEKLQKGQYTFDIEK